MIQFSGKKLHNELCSYAKENSINEANLSQSCTFLNVDLLGDIFSCLSAKRRLGLVLV